MAPPSRPSSTHTSVTPHVFGDGARSGRLAHAGIYRFLPDLTTESLEFSLVCSRYLGEGRSSVAGAIVNALLLGLLVLGVAVSILAPLTALGVMFWHWQKELKESMRLRQARTTQIR